MKNLTEEKIKKITERIRVADLGLQNAARFKQEKEEKKAYEKIRRQEDLKPQKSDRSVREEWFSDSTGPSNCTQ